MLLETFHKDLEIYNDLETAHLEIISFHDLKVIIDLVVFKIAVNNEQKPEKVALVEIKDQNEDGLRERLDPKAKIVYACSNADLVKVVRAVRLLEDYKVCIEKAVENENAVIEKVLVENKTSASETSDAVAFVNYKKVVYSG